MFKGKMGWANDWFVGFSSEADRVSWNIETVVETDYEIYLPGGSEPIGKVTSGVLSPTLGYPIAMAYLKADLELAPGSKLEADVRGTRVPYEIVKLPFYKAER